MPWTDAAVFRRERTAAVEGEVDGQVDRLLQHLKEERNGAVEGREGLPRVDASRAVTAAVVASAVSWT